MNPEVEFFLEKALGSVQPTSPEIGRVVVEPEYEAKPIPRDAGHLASELIQCVQEQMLDPAALSSHDGLEIQIPGSYRLLKKYIRRITLHHDKADGTWVEVAPPGNWI
jgi:hypothetical protein